MNNDTKIVPNATDVDYSNLDEIYGYHLLLGKIFEKAGGLNFPPVNNPLIRECQKQGLVWLREVKTLIADVLAGKSHLTLASIPELTSAYDLMFRISNGGTCSDYLRKVKLKTVDRWVKGDKSISQTDVTLLILAEIDRDIRKVENRYSDFALDVMNSWIDELIENRRFMNIPLSEAYRRLTYLLKTNLFVCLGDNDRQDIIKKAWTNEYVLSDQKEIDTYTLFRYVGFLITASQRNYYDSEPKDELYSRLWSNYISRSDVNPYFRQALEIDLNKAS